MSTTLFRGLGLRRGALVCLGSLALACSWGRFDDISENSPVVLLNKPETLQSGFGVTLTAVDYADRSQLLSGGTTNRSGAAVFDVGHDEDPGIDASAVSHCVSKGKDECYLGAHVAGMARAKSRSSDKVSRELCFALGLGSEGEEKGVVVRCDKGFTYILDVPAGAGSLFSAGSLGKSIVTLHAGPEKAPALTVGAGREKLAWYYSPNGLVDGEFPPELEVPDLDDAPTYGQAVASFAVGDGHVAVVGHPGTSRVWLFLDAADAPAGTPPVLLGCLSGPDDFGRTLAVGNVTTGEDGDLVVAAEDKVYVFDGEVLADIEPPADPSTRPTCASATKHEALLATLSCANTGEVEGCATSNFGAALAVGDLDGDGDGEVIVGAPDMTARDVSQAGAVLIYDIDGKSGSKLGDARFLASAEDGDQLGAALAAPSVGKRHIIAAGAPGNGKTALFYCSALGGKSPRCE